MQNEKITGRVKASIASMLSPALTHFAPIKAVVQHPVIHWINDPRQIGGIDRVCIDKSNNNELTEAINSMFRWYQGAARCYVYLLDVSVRTQDGQVPHMEWDSSFRNSRWFTRGWTLQELLAPKIVEFYSRDHIRLGDKISFEEQIHEITGITIEALRGRCLQEFGVQERFQWVGYRQTTMEEDMAYCLLGIFDVYLPLIYGEGQVNAMRRLEKEVNDRGSKKNESRSFGKSCITNTISPHIERCLM
jgi:hypothetical protein